MLTGSEALLTAREMSFRSVATANWLYALDWLLIAAMFGASIWMETWTPVQRFIVPDPTIQYPYQVDTVPSYLLGVFALVLPGIALGLYMKIVRKAPWSELHLALLGLFLTVGLTYFLTNVIKLSTGRLRPDFLSRCRPDPNISSVVTCTGDARLIREGRKSFPSGHTSFSFAGLSYLSLYLLGHFRMEALSGRSFKMLVVLAPLILALWVGMSRISDYRHHWQDVLCGALLGIGVAYGTYRQYFPSPLSLFSDGILPPLSVRQQRRGLREILPGEPAMHLEPVESERKGVPASVDV